MYFFDSMPLAIRAVAQLMHSIRVYQADCICSPLFVRPPRAFAASLDMFIYHLIASMRHMRDRIIQLTRKFNIGSCKIIVSY